MSEISMMLAQSLMIVSHAIVMYFESTGYTPERMRMSPAHLQMRRRLARANASLP